MTDSNDISRLSGATIAKLVIALTAAFCFLMYGATLPYLHTSFRRTFQCYALFPLVIVGFVYVTLIHKWPTGRTGYQMAMKNCSDKQERFRQRVLAVMGTLLISWGIADFSVGVPAWIAYYTASNPIKQMYQILAVTEHGGPGFTGWFDLELRDLVSGEVVELPVKRTDYPETMYARPIWRVGDTLCVRGRTSFFGTIIDKTTRNTDRC